MDSGESISQWICQLKDGQRDAVQKLWEGYFTRLVGMARQWLRHAPTQAAEAEDVALSAFDSFCRRAEQGRFPRLSDRDDLWQLLVVIAFRKACNQIKHEARRRPRHAQLIHASALDAEDAAEGPLFADLIGREPDPAFAAQTAEEYRGLLARLSNEQLRAIAVWKLEGFTNEEIAVKIGRSVVTVERKLALIRGYWEKGFSLLHSWHAKTSKTC
jgi:DNA-directed RNA polymerase specialized sigma24 family protein